MSGLRVAALTVGVLLAISLGIASIIVSEGRFIISGPGTILIIIGLVGLMPLFDSLLGD